MLPTQLVAAMAALLSFGLAPAALAQILYPEQTALPNDSATILQSNVLQNIVLILPNVPTRPYADSWGWRSSRSLTPSSITVVILNSQVNLAAKEVEPRPCGQRCTGSLRLP